MDYSVNQFLLSSAEELCVTILFPYPFRAFV